MVVATSSLAQSIKVSGTVFDENGSALPGVSILIKNSTPGYKFFSYLRMAYGKNAHESSHPYIHTQVKMWK